MKTGDNKRRNDYSCVAFHEGEKVNFMKYVQHPNSYRIWLKKEGLSWDHINVYWRRSGDFEKRIDE